MVHDDGEICAIIRAFAGARGISATYASRLLAGSGDTLSRIEAGMSISTRRAAAIAARAAACWPNGAVWPPDIPRPPPSPNEEAA